MKEQGRRNFLAGLAGAFGSLLLAGCATKSQVGSADGRLSGNLLALGTDGHLYPGFSAKDHNKASVLTAVNLANGKVLQTALPMGGGHQPMPLGDGRILCIAHHKTTSIAVDANHKEIKRFVAPEEYVYGGHGIVLPDRGVFIMCMRFKNPQSLTDHGKLEVYDLKTLQLLNQVDSGGLHPHEIHAIPGSDELITTHYGDIYQPNPPYTHNVIEPKLTVLDAKTMIVKRHFKQDFNAMVTHMNVNHDGYAYYVMTQYVEPEGNYKKLRLSKDAVTPSGEEVSPAMNRVQEMAAKMPADGPKRGSYDAALLEVDAALEKVIGHKREFAIPYEAAKELKLPIPLPFVRVNVKTGEREVLMTEEGNHLRSQSVAYNSKTGTMMGIYYHADTAILHKTGQKPEVLLAGAVGLSEMRGGVDIPGTPYVGLVAAHRGMVVYDIEKREVVERFPYQYFDTVHLGYSPEA
jgi:hypothetical protein